MINSIVIKDDLANKLEHTTTYKNLDASQQKEAYAEIEIIEDAFKQVELIKSGKLKTYPIKELLDTLDD